MHRHEIVEKIVIWLRPPPSAPLKLGLFYNLELLFLAKSTIEDSFPVSKFDFKSEIQLRNNGLHHFAMACFQNCR